MLFRLLLITIVIAPLPFGSYREWAWSLLSLLIALLSIFWSLGQIRSSSKAANPLTKKLILPIILFCIPLLWAFIQVIPDLRPDKTHPIWQMTSQALGQSIPNTISTSPYDTTTAAMRLLSYGLVFLLAAQYCQRSENAKKLFDWIAFAGLCYATYSLIIYFGKFNNVLGYADVYQGASSGTFVNRNSYATYAGLAILCAIPKLYSTLKNSTHFGISSNFGKQYFIEHMLKDGWYIIINLIISLTALLLTQSRGGNLSALIGLIFLFTLLSFNKNNKQQKFTYATTGILALLLVIFQISGGMLMARISVLDVSTDGRQLIFQNLIQAIGNNPWLGMGYGSFENSFRLYRNETLNFHVNLGHNTYLENIFELGLPQALCLILAIAIVAYYCFRGYQRRQKNNIYPALGFSATILVASHSMTDFSLQMPAIAVTYAAILGAGFAQSFNNSTRKKKQ